MRGKLRVLVGCMRGVRIIPTHAGQTFALMVLGMVPPDHPRACGANVHGDVAGLQLVGSSPRMRGKLRPALEGRARLRIIPAHAGQTAYVARHRDHRPDHPRACGANFPDVLESLEHAGSSPRMRGKPSMRLRHAGGARIIPAHAGQTCR